MTATRSFLSLFFSSTLLFTVMSVQAAEPKFLGSYRDWEAYRLTENGNRICYVASQPKKMEGKYKKRGDVAVFVTHRPANRERDVVNFQAGYTFKNGSSVEVAIDDRKFSLFTKDDTAWARSEGDERAIVKAMIKGKRMAVRGMSSRGTRTTDTYSLLGFTRAYKKINQACGVK